MFNVEGGCYAKVIRLSAEAEPQIYATTRRFGTILENVAVDDGGVLDLDDDSKTENTRAAYKLEEIANALPAKRAGHPSAVVMLTADAFGVLPPIARLTRDQAMFYFLSGYTAKVAGTEIGVTEPQATFSTCFGAPFLPQPPAVYARMLGDKLDLHPHVTVWLVNTGWTGGPFGEGHRMPIAATRALLRAAARGRPAGRRVSGRPGVRLRGAGERARRRLQPARPAVDVGRSRRLRRQGRRPRTHVPRQLRPVRGHGRRGRHRGRARRVIPDAPWRVVVVSQIPGIAKAYVDFVRAIGHEPVAHLAVRTQARLAESQEMRDFALRLLMEGPEGVDLVYPASKASLAPILRGYEADLLLCTAFPWRLPADALAVPRVGCVNGHPSLLPRHRGPIPIAWAMRNGETEIGLTYHLMDADFDTGNILAQQSVPLDADDTLETLLPKLQGASAALLPVVFERLARGRARRSAGGRRLPERVRGGLRLRRHGPNRPRGAHADEGVAARGRRPGAARPDPRARRRVEAAARDLADRGRGSRAPRVRRRAALDRRERAGRLTRRRTGRIV